MYFVVFSLHASRDTLHEIRFTMLRFYHYRNKMKKNKRNTEKRGVISAGTKRLSFPIAGVGASAGGLEACQELLKNLSAKPGLAFVFIMHLAPEHKSMLTELLARSTKMPVREIKNGIPIEINNVYVIPPGTTVSIAGGKLKLNKMRDAGLKRMPVDWFFHSLAGEHGNRAIGVILSGTATDGTLGAEDIKTEGGIVFAQDEKSAKYDGMPQSAIGAGCVDFVLSPKKIAAELERIAKHPLLSAKGSVKKDKSIKIKGKGVEGIFEILQSVRGLDFTHYKTNTVSRRISRRMVLLKLEKIRDYIKFLRTNKNEVENLYEDLLLKVTSFFRDPHVFDTLKKLVIPAILKNKTKGQEVRIWVPGCSSGEEAYSIAMCLIESLGNKKITPPVKIFATDASESNINKARQGIYGKNIKDDVSPQRLKRFFAKTGSSYKVSKLLRDMCIFSKQNVFSDPPFSNLDLISCRNLLIYFQPVLQKKVFHNFHYGIKPGGFLLLGNSESVGGYSSLFKPLDNKHKIFVKKYQPGTPKLELSQKYYPQKKLESQEKPDIGKPKAKDINTENLVERIVLSEYAVCGVLIDSDMEVIQFRGRTGRFLESAAGKPSLNIFKLAPKGLFQPLHTAIYKARGTKHTVKMEAADIKCNGRKMRVGITVIPVKSGEHKEELFLVLFDEISKAGKPKNLPKTRGKSAPKDDNYIESLQRELSETKEYLQTVIEEQDNVNEEVKTANEEILSSNEELLSTNEELETAKEELQSSNEELVTTNEELQNRNKEVILLNNDLTNLLVSINMPVIMMGTDLVIRRITPQAEKALNVISSDIGRSISRIKLNVDIPDFEKILLEVIETLHSQTFEIKDKDENWYLVCVRPYRTLDNRINGVVAIFNDITKRKLIEEDLATAKEEEFRTVFENAVDGIVIVDIESRKFYRSNDEFCRLLGYSPDEIKKLGIMDIHPEKDLPYVIEQFEKQVKGEIHLAEDLPVKRKDGSVFYADINATSITIAGRVYMIGFFRDTTKRKEAEDLLRASEEKYRSLFISSHDAIMTFEPPDWKYTSGNPTTIKMFGMKTEAEFLTYDPWRLSPERQPDGQYSIDKAKEMIETAMRNGSHFFEWTHKRVTGEDFLTNVLLSRVEQGEKVSLYATVRDVTQQKHLEEELKIVNEQKAAAEMKSRFTSMVSHELRTPLTAIKEGIALVVDEVVGTISDEQKELLNISKKNVDRLSRLINNVLDFQKLDSGRMKFNIETADINETVKDAYETMVLSAKKAGLNFTLELAPALPKCSFDKDKIIQVMANLLTNAIKFTANGYITIKTAQAGDFIQVSVSDTGCGIRKSDLSKVFGRFEQLYHGGERKTGGSGLGLAISKEIIERHKGKISVESTVAKGSKFTFTLPLPRE